jgi:hypothetical protein
MTTLAISPAEAGPIEWYLAIFAGQSNNSDRAPLEDYPGFPHTDRVRIFSNAWQWVHAAEPMDSAIGQVDTVSSDYSPPPFLGGPGVATGSAFAGLRPKARVGLVPCALGGTSITLWTRNLSRSTLYGSMIARIQEAMSDPDRFIKGVCILWNQGDKDRDDLAVASTWDDRCYQFRDDICSDLGIADIPFVVTVTPNQSGAYVSMIQSQQLAMTGTNLRVVDSRDLPLDVNGHYTAAGHVTIGGRFAAAMDDIFA